MAGQQKPWEKDWSAPQPGITIKPPNPRQPYEAPLAAQQLENERLRAAQMRAQLAKDNPPAADPRYDALTGTEYLKHLSSTDAAKVRALADGRLAFPSGAGMRSPYWQQMVDHVAHYDPTFDAVNYQARQHTRVDFTSGKSAQNIRALNTAIGHLGQLADAMHDTESGPVTPLNAVGNSFNRYVRGQSGPQTYDQTAAAVASELTQVFRATGGAEADVKRFLADLSVNASEEQKRAAFKNLSGLLQSRLNALGDQYNQGMGTTRDGLSLLNPKASAVLGAVSDGHSPKERGIAVDDPTGWHYTPPFAPQGGGNTPPPGGPPGPAGQGGPPAAMDGTPQAYRAPASDQNMSVPTSGTISVADPARGALANRMEAMVGDRQQSDAAIVKFATDNGIMSPSLLAQLKFRRENPGYGGAYKATGFDHRDQPMTGTQSWMNWGANSAPGAAVLNAGLSFGELGNGVTGGALERVFGDPAQNRAVIAAINAQHPIAAALGTIAGGAIGAAGAEKAAVKAAEKLGPGMFGRGARAIAPYAADAAFGAAQGAGAAEDGSRLDGALLGAALGAGGGAVGRKVIGPLIGQAAATETGQRLLQPVGNAVRRAFNKPETSLVPRPDPATSMVMGGAGKAGVADIQAQLAEAARLGVPMSLADTSPQLTTLAGAAVRRSPNADQIAQNALLPRSRGQIDRLGQAVDTHLGPVGNIPQISADLQTQARTAAAPLYDRAYAAPGAGNADISSLLATPFGKQALGRAHSIAGNERIDPTTLSIDLNDHGEPVLTRAPSYRTLDLVKRGMDDVLEQQRNPMTGRLQLDESGRAQLGVKNDLLSAMDAQNPDYAAARRAYAGPMQSRDALARGQDSFTANPNQLGVDIAGASPEQMGQMQLGYRGALMDQANRVRFSGNPFDATLGNPAAEQRLATMYPGNPGNADLLRTRDLESGLARSTNDIIGNSKTAQRGIADSAFAEGGLGQIALDAGLNLATGQVPIGLIAKRGVLQGARDAVKFGVGKRAVAKADALAPILLNPDPVASSATLDDLVNSSQAYRDFVSGQRRKAGRLGGMFGAGVGAGLPYGR